MSTPNIVYKPRSIGYSEKQGVLLMNQIKQAMILPEHSDTYNPPPAYRVAQLFPPNQPNSFHVLRRWTKWFKISARCAFRRWKNYPPLESPFIDDNRTAMVRAEYLINVYKRKTNCI